MLNTSDIHDLLHDKLKNSIEFIKTESNKSLSLGSSKIGGKSHLPQGFQWPYYKGTNFDGKTVNRPLSFIAQFNLTDVAEYDADGLLPHNGFLYFFYELDTMCWGFDPKDIGCAKVFYYDVLPSMLSETEYPHDLDPSKYVPERSIEFKNAKSLPSIEEFGERTGEYINDWEAYNGAASDYGVNFDMELDGTFKLLGYANTIQGSMLCECESVTNGIYCGSPQQLSNEQKKKIAEGSKEWVLLAQFGTLSDELMFGDCGCIYYYIRNDDLKKCRFDKTHLILQCG